MQKSGVAAQDAIRSLTEQLGTLKTHLSATNRDGGPAAPEDLRGRVAAVADSVGAVERALSRDVGSVNRLVDAISGYTGLPTQGQARQSAWARENLNASITRLNALLQKSIPDLYAALQTRKVWPSAVPAIPLPPRGSR